MDARRYNFKILLVVLAILITSCASKPKKEEAPPYPIPSEQNASRVTPIDPTTGLPLPPPASQFPTDGSQRDKPGIGLVIGGAGVASFATVGILKRLHAEGIKVDFIVTTGWPTIFSVGYGFLRSVHDLEWFAMRLTDADFKRIGELSPESEISIDTPLPKVIDSTFERKDLAEARVKVFVSAINTDIGDPEVFDKGEWKTPLIKTMSLPGIYRKYPENPAWISKMEGIDVDEAVRQRASMIVAVSIYDDYVQLLRLKAQGKDAANASEVLKKLKEDIANQMELAQVKTRIILGKSALDFSQKRLAIVTGYQEGAKIAKQIKALLK